MLNIIWGKIHFSLRCVCMYSVKEFFSLLSHYSFLRVNRRLIKIRTKCASARTNDNIDYIIITYAARLVISLSELLFIFWANR